MPKLELCAEASEAIIISSDATVQLVDVAVGKQAWLPSSGSIQIPAFCVPTQDALSLAGWRAGRTLAKTIAIYCY